MMAEPSKHVAAALACAGLLFATTRSASADPYRWRAAEGEEHGSQVASSEWLPIFIGAAAGVVVGGLTGTAFDQHQPPVLGALIGGGLGALTGGGAGAWIIRSTRENDTRFAGAVTGLGVGGGIGVVLFTNIDSTPGKVAALVLVPVMGAFAGRSLAIHFGTKSSTTSDAPPPPPTVSLRPSVTPIFGRGMGATGMTIGVDGAFF